MRATNEKNPARIAGEAGYTFVESLIAMFLMTITMGGMYSVLFQGQATFDAQQDAMALRQQARVAMDEMATQIRMAGASIDNLPAPLVQGAAETIVFVADIDAGSAAPPCGAAVENALNGGAERITFRREPMKGPRREAQCRALRRHRGPLGSVRSPRRDRGNPSRPQRRTAPAIRSSN